MYKKDVKVGECYEFNNRTTNIYWKVIKVQDGGILCKCPQNNRSLLIDKKLFKKNYTQIIISKLNTGGKQK